MKAGVSFGYYNKSNQHETTLIIKSILFLMEFYYYFLLLINLTETQSFFLVNSIVSLDTHEFILNLSLNSVRTFSTVVDCFSLAARSRACNPCAFGAGDSNKSNSTHLDEQHNSDKLKSKSTQGQVGSSETKHEATNDFLDWFVGFLEGDGGFYFDTKTKRNYIKFRQKDYKVLYKIKSYFGFGSLFKSSDGYISLVFSGKTNLLTIIQVVNGRFHLNKTHTKFNIWLNHFNKWNNLDISLLPQAVFNRKTAWLSGFSDADGSFSIKLQKDTSRTIGYRLRLAWYIDQSFEKDFLLTLKESLNTGTISQKTKDSDAWRLQVDAFNKLGLIFTYFDCYQPKTTKLFVRYIRCKRVFNYYMNNTWRTKLKEIRHLIVLNKKLNLRNYPFQNNAAHSSKQRCSN